MFEAGAEATHIPPAAALTSERVGAFRWVVVALLFVAMVFNYVDRQTIAVLKPTLQHEFGWSESAYADIIFWFQAAYALSYLTFGMAMDRIGARIGYMAAFSIWSVGHLLHAAVGGVGGFIFARVVLGVGESGSFPAGLKAVAEWFPKKERALANGLFNAGANIGAIVTPLVVPAIALTLGWRWVFIITAIPGVIWLAAWIILYRRPDKSRFVGAAELAYIQSDGPDPAHKLSWRQIISRRETWAYAAGRFLIDPVWWLFLFWLPDFLSKRYGLDLRSFGPPLVVIYVLSDLGSVGGGWLSSALMKRGVGPNRARKFTLLLCALAVTPVAFAAHAAELWLAVGILGLATAGHQAFSANLYALPADLFPRSAVGTVVGMGGFSGTVGGMLMSKYAGYMLDRVGSYTPIFIVAACAYLAALLVIHLLSPRYAPIAPPLLAPAV